MRANDKVTKNGNQGTILRVTPKSRGIPALAFVAWGELRHALEDRPFDVKEDNWDSARGENGESWELQRDLVVA